MIVLSSSWLIDHFSSKSVTDLWALRVCLAVCWWRFRTPPSWRWQTSRSSWSRCRWCDPPCPWSPAAPAPWFCLFRDWLRLCFRKPTCGILRHWRNESVKWLLISSAPSSSISLLSLLMLPYLYVLYPVLQQDLNTTSHPTEELIEKRQILNSVLIQQMSQPWKFATTETGQTSSSFDTFKSQYVLPVWYFNIFDIQWLM